MPAADAAKLAEWVGRWHIALVHFPIGLIAGAGLAEFLAWAKGSRAARMAASFCVQIGAAAAALAALLGWLLADALQLEGALAAQLELHRWCGLAASALALLAAWLCQLSERPNGGRLQTLYRWSLAAAVALVLASARLGGQLVWGPDFLF